MDTEELSSMTQLLEENLDDLEGALKPLLETSIIDTANTLPVLERSKLYVLVTYAIESLIFSFLRGNGVNAKEHPVFRELTRVKQYFEKIKAAEFPEEQQPKMRIDQPAVGRMLKHSLAGNTVQDEARGETGQADQPSKKRKKNKDSK